uniref:Uncharacterized protein n=1 Tax=Arundo donax TaxID=35708 RepID=A0A0A8ZZF0_ARUDO
MLKIIYYLIVYMSTDSCIVFGLQRIYGVLTNCGTECYNALRLTLRVLMQYSLETAED